MLMRAVTVSASDVAERRCLYTPSTYGPSRPIEPWYSCSTTRAEASVVARSSAMTVTLAGCSCSPMRAGHTLLVSATGSSKLLGGVAGAARSSRSAVPTNGQLEQK